MKILSYRMMFMYYIWLITCETEPEEWPTYASLRDTTGEKIQWR
jgi:hypothetical protein